jgi:pimeloyl-ACP methyl ester carboxylesterase
VWRDLAGVVLARCRSESALLADMTETLERPDGIISYDDPGGSGRLVVAAPGMGDMRQVYRHIIDEGVSRNLRIVTMDVRGMGNSSVDWPDYSDAAIGGDMLALAGHLDSGPAVLVGNSLTAASAVIAAVQDPALVSGLVLIGPFARNVATPAWQSLVFRLMLTPPWGKSAWVWYYRNQMYPGDRPPDHDDYVNDLKANLSEPGRYSAFRSLAFNSHDESGSKLGQVNCPVAIVMGTADPDFADPEAEARGLAAAMNADVVLVEGAGHYPQAQDPTAVADTIKAVADQSD